MRTQRFGIEIEMTGITRKEAADVVANYFGGLTHQVGGAYDEYHVFDTKARNWKIVSDASIVPMKKEQGKLVEAFSRDYKVELVSPILTYQDIEPLQELVRELRAAGAVSDSQYSSGIHIHIDAKPHTPNTLKNLVNLMASKEELLYKSLNIDMERLRYCKKVNDDLIATINKKKPKTIETLADIWYAGYGNEDRTRHYHNSRYHGLNLHSTFNKGTVEFRLFNGTLHAGKIKAYIQFCLALSHQALSQKSASAKRTTTDNEKYTFRCWMLRLGLIGDEFKTCRHHFLEMLDGNSAWRHAS
ncbi:amidoligase family protein [Pelosinus sp. sgz500959]|uniref:amidoligase family protein n=1 Tax=Pelosinus sp. sgz500959 TaxID=3242472 RepID=UPI003672B50B